MASLSELHALEQAKQQATPPPQDDTEFDDGPDDQMVQDLNSGAEIMGSMVNFLNYMGDRTLIKSVSKRERVIMQNLAEQARKWLVEVDATYGGGE